MNVRSAPQPGHVTSGGSRWTLMGSSGTASLLRRGLLAACRAAFRAVVADVVSWDVEDTRACAAGSAAKPHAPRVITACRFRLAHHSPLHPPKQRLFQA